MKQFESLKNDTDRVYAYITFADENKDKPALSVPYALKALELSENKHMIKVSVRACEHVGDAYWYAHNYVMASEYYLRELRLADSLGMKRSKARAYYNIGWIKCIQQESYKDRPYLLKALKTLELMRDTESVVEVYHALAGTYQGMAKADKKYVDSALFYFRNLVYFSENFRHGDFNVVIHANYSTLLMQIGRYKEARKYLQKCCDVSLQKKDTASYVMSKHYLANMFLKMDSVDKAKKIYEEIFPMLLKGDPGFLPEAYRNRSRIRAAEKDYKGALQDMIRCKEIADSVDKGVLEADLKDKEAAIEIDKREYNIKKLEHINELSELKNRQNKYVISGLGFMAFLIVVVSVNLFKSNRTKQRANKVLNEKNTLIAEQKKAVEERNLDITNSINYAKRIQDAILPQKELKYKLFPDAFVLYQPKDIVSGDFYWFAEKNGRRLIAAIDCTGHGVPGAFMSMIGNTFLHEAVNQKGIISPSHILNELRNNVVSSLKQNDIAGSTKDGMDMALLSFNDAEGSVEFAGANNPLWLIRDGECIEYKADKRPIGYQTGAEEPFTSITIKLQKGDSLYIFSDGYADQFGGQAGKKFKYRQLKEVLLSVEHLPMKDQETHLLEKFNSWKGQLEQVDDVCVIGVRC